MSVIHLFVSLHSPFPQRLLLLTVVIVIGYRCKPGGLMLAF